MLPLRILGGLMVVAGLVLAIDPTLVSDAPSTDDLFEAIERHVRWGLLSGIGLLLAVRTKLKPWLETFAHAVLWIVLAYLVVRLLGIAIEGTESQKQWMWVAIEAVIVVFPAIYLWRRRGAEPEPSSAGAD